MKKRKILSLVSLLMATAMLAGCGAATGTGGSGGGAEKPTNIKLYFAGSVSGTQPMGVEHNDVIDLIQERTGTEIEFMQDTSMENLMPLLASGELPDLTYITDLKHASSIIQGGLAIPLDEYMDEYGKDIMENAPAKVEYARNFYGGEEKKLWGIMGSSGLLGTPSYYTFGPQLRWDLYEKLGYPEMNTYMDILPILKDMLELEPNNKDGKVNYGFSLNTDWDTIIPLNLMFIGPLYGVQLENSFHAEIDNANGYTVKNMFDEDSWTMKTAEFMFEANQMGLVDPESMTQKWDNVSDKILTGRCFIQLVNWPVGGYNNEQAKLGDDSKGFMPVYPKDSTTLWEGVSNEFGTGGMWFISSKCKHPEKALSIINCLNTIEASTAIYSGIEGVHWDMVDGHPRTRDDVYEKLQSDDEYKDKAGIIKYWNMAGLLQGTMLPGSDNEAIGSSLWNSSFERSARTLEKNYLAYYGVQRPSQAYDKQRTKVVSDDIYASYMEAMPDDIALISQKISDMANTEFYKLMFAKDKAEFDKLKKEIIQKANDLGLETEMNWIMEEREKAKQRYEEATN